MGLNSDFSSLYRSARSHLRKTKKNMIKPFEWQVGKKGKSLHSGEPLTQKQKRAVKQRMADRNRKGYRAMAVKAFILLILSIIFFALIYFHY